MFYWMQGFRLVETYKSDIGKDPFTIRAHAKCTRMLTDHSMFSAVWDPVDRNHTFDREWLVTSPSRPLNSWGRSPFRSIMFAIRR